MKNKATISGKVAVVTGAARGIGLAIAERFHKEGYQVVIIDRDKDAMEACAWKLAGETGYVFQECDVSDPVQVKASFKGIVQPVFFTL